MCRVSAPALSHPHAWIETRSDVVFDDDGRITAINVEWVFDQWYSELAVEGLDTNNDGYYSAGELHPLARENLIALKDYGYFVYARSGGEGGRLCRGKPVRHDLQQRQSHDVLHLAPG
jgi:ABC-type uncharacterized transport system substrate-binding protein